MFGYTVRKFILATVLVGSTIAVAPSANAGSPFDGRWSVVGVSETLGCPQSMRIEGEIVDSYVKGDTGLIKGLGRVAPSGAASFAGRVGPFPGVAVGRLSKNSGRGTWRIQGQNVTCSGTWTAQRI
jgi:hypothetical protein